jgi:hypothetical protein
MNLLKPDPKYRRGFKDPERMAAIHNIPCSLCYTKGWTQATRTTAHHRHGYGAGKKESDLLTMSLCETHHQSGRGAFHNLNREDFEELYNVTQDELIEITDELLEDYADY